ncbi:MAG: branched-chain amino acid ABC transporter substrate-binding protein [Deltaproteobacteria bacterium]|nr:branched-chain amino acid ABC transporter substrate-binding protein [Deltaproteobacteria bacterium]
MKFKKLKLFVLTIITAIFISAGAFAETLKIGSMGPLTGPYAADGNDIANGVRSAIAVIEDEGGIEGFDKIELFAEDTACDPRQAVAAANKLINSEVIGVIGAYCSSATIPASEVLAEEDIIMITPASTNEKVTERELKYMFRMCGRDDDQSKAAVSFLKYKKAKTVFIIDDKTTYSQGLAENVAKGCEAAGIKVILHDHVNQGDKDFSAVLTKLKSKAPDALYMSLQNSATGSLMAIQAKRIGIEATILSQDAVYHPQFIDIAKDAAEGIYLTCGFMDKGTESYKNFIAKFQKITGTDKSGAYSVYAYDSAITLLKAIKKTGGTDPAKIKEAMLKMNYQGASKNISFKENGDSSSSYIIFKVENKNFKNHWNPETGELFSETK